MECSYSSRPLAFEHSDRLDVLGVRKHVHAADSRQPESTLAEARLLGRELLRVAGHVDNPRRAQRADPIDDGIRTALTRRIEDDYLELLTAYAGQRVFDATRNEPDLFGWNPVEPEIGV